MGFIRMRNREATNAATHHFQQPDKRYSIRHAHDKKGSRAPQHYPTQPFLIHVRVLVDNQRPHMPDREGDAAFVNSFTAIFKYHYSG